MSQLLRTLLRLLVVREGEGGDGGREDEDT